MTLIEEYCDQLKLPYIKEFAKKEAEISQSKGDPYLDFLTRIMQQEIFNKQSRSIQTKIKCAQFPSIKTRDSFDIKAIPTLDPKTINLLFEGSYSEKAQNIILLGPSGTGKTHLATALGVAACQQNKSVLFQTASHLVHSLIEARDAKQLLLFQKKLMTYKVLIIDELGYVPFSNAGSEMLFEVLAKRYEHGSVILTSNLPFEEWTHIFGSERLTGALLDRITHHAHIIPMNGESYRVASKLKKQNQQ